MKTLSFFHILNLYFLLSEKLIFASDEWDFSPLWKTPHFYAYISEHCLLTLRCYNCEGVLGFSRGAVETAHQTLECLFCNWLRLLDFFFLPWTRENIFSVLKICLWFFFLTKKILESGRFWLKMIILSPILIPQNCRK